MSNITLELKQEAYLEEIIEDACHVHVSCIGVGSNPMHGHSERVECVRWRQLFQQGFRLKQPNIKDVNVYWDNCN